PDATAGTLRQYRGRHVRGRPAVLLRGLVERGDHPRPADQRAGLACDEVWLGVEELGSIDGAGTRGERACGVVDRRDDLGVVEVPLGARAVEQRRTGLVGVD